MRSCLVLFIGLLLAVSIAAVAEESSDLEGKLQELVNVRQDAHSTLEDIHHVIESNNAVHTPPKLDALLSRKRGLEQLNSVDRDYPVTSKDIHEYRLNERRSRVNEEIYDSEEVYTELLEELGGYFFSHAQMPMALFLRVYGLSS